MGTFSCSVEVFAADGSRTVTVAAVVDTGSTYTCLPGTVLRELGIAPVRKAQAQLAYGSVVDDELGEAKVRLRGVESTTIVIFAEEGAPALLGAYTLEGSLLAVDPVELRLVPAIALKMGRLNSPAGNSRQ